MRFDRITLDDGLSQSNVFSILQDSQGLMWFGTENGLNSYNGYEFEVFKRDRGNPAALGSDYIYDIVEGADGNLWIASNGGGLSKMDRASKTFTSYRHDPASQNGPASNVIRKLLVDKDGSIWLGTRGAGLDRFDARDGTFSNFRFGPAGDPARDANEIFALHRDSRGAMWVGTNNGLIRLNTETGDFQHFTHSADDTTSISGHKVRAIFEDSHGELWAGTYTGGLNRFNRERGTFDRFQHDASNEASISGNRITSFFEDNEGRLWVGTYEGLNLLDRTSGEFVRYQHESQDATSLGDNAITAIYQDRGGILWFGTRNQGLNKWNPRSWSYGLEHAKQLTESGESKPNVTSFAEDAAGILWIGTFGDGLHAMDRKNGVTTTYRHDPSDSNSISDDRVMSLMQDRKGQIWVGTMTGGLNRLDPATGTITVFKHEEQDSTSLSANGIMAIFEDSAGQIWVGTYGGGVSRLQPGSKAFTRFLPSTDSQNAISSSRVRSFAEDRSGKIWIGTDAGGLNLYDPATGSFDHFRHDPNDPGTLADDTIYAVNVDDNGTVWVGTQGGGLDRVVGSAADPQHITFSNVSQSDGLANDVIYGLQFDNTGTIWMSTNYGISRYDPRSGAIKNMHRKDGLQSEEFNSGAHYRSAGGELFFGGANGFNAFKPGEIKTSNVVPLVMLTGMFSGNDPIKADTPDEEGDGVNITYKDDTVSFEFAALDYAASEKNEYRYKLEGFDAQWIELGNRRRVTYTDLNDGQYLLRVQAANSDGVWNEAGITVPVRVSPAPWDTWWAYLGYLAMAAQLAVVLWLGHQRKIRREEEYSSRLEEEVRERTEKLVESNLKLKELNQTLQESSLSDPLTGLRNRRFVFEEVSRDLDVIRRKIGDEDQGVDSKTISDLVFMMIDLDNFKPINDTYGHAAGDQMLLEVRDVLLGTCRKSDFVIRWGGDEFVVIAKQARSGESEALAERIRSKIAEHNFMLADGQIVRTTCSIGFAAFPLFRAQAEDADLDQILTLADSLMYEAKRQRNAWAGMLSPSIAATSYDFDHSTIEPTSLLFRAKRAGQLIAHRSTADNEHGPTDMSATA
jgi:diguanylate cyclase (GGDEF)-like protein